jgi:hypothetical protein
MPISELSATLSADTDQRYMDGWVAAANAAGETPEAFVEQFLRDQGKTYAGLYKVGTWPAAAFVLRFTTEEITAIRAAAETDENVAGILAQLGAEPFVAVDDPRVGPGVGYLVMAGLLTQERAAEVLAYDRPEPDVTE